MLAYDDSKNTIITYSIDEKNYLQPYYISFNQKLSEGSHILYIKVVDLWGNITKDSVFFEISMDNK